MKKAVLILSMLTLIAGLLLVSYGCNSKKSDDENGMVVLTESDFNKNVGINGYEISEFSVAKLKEYAVPYVAVGETYYLCISFDSVRFFSADVRLGGNIKIEGHYSLCSDKEIGAFDYGEGMTGISNPDPETFGEPDNGYDYAECSSANLGKTKKADYYVAVKFSVNSPAYEKMKISVFLTTILADSSYSDKELVKEGELDVYYEKRVSSEMTLKYLTNADYGNGDFDDGKLKDSIEVPSGEKFFAVIDCALEGENAIVDTDRLGIAFSVAYGNGVTVNIGAEAFPTGDYREDGDGTVKAEFGIYGEKKKLRFIVGVTAAGNGTPELSARFYGDGVSFLGTGKITASFTVSTEIYSESKLKFEKSADGSYYIVTGLGSNTGDLISIPAQHEGIPVKRVNDGAFQNYNHIKKVTVADGVEEIGRNAFKNMEKLESVYLPKSVTVIGENAFSGLPKVSVYCDIARKPDGYAEAWTEEETYVTWDFQNCFIISDDRSYCLFTYKDDDSGTYGTDKYGVNIAVPATFNNIPVTGIDFIAFYGSKTVKKVRLPDTLTSIGANAFAYSTLEYINLPKELRSIGDNAFRGTLSGVKDLVIPDSVTYIGRNAFSACTTLESVTIGKSVENIYAEAFYSCNKLEKVINRSSLDFWFGEKENGYVAYYATKMIVERNGKTYTYTK